MRRTFFLLLASGALVGAGLNAPPLFGADPAWKAGVSCAKITPEPPMYLAGFGGRANQAEADGKLHDIWVKVLVLEDAHRTRAALITSDVCGVSRATYLRLCTQLRQRCGLEQSQVLLTYSHTHTGPALHECLQDYTGWDEKARARIKDYTSWLEATIVDRVAEAEAKLEPVALSAGEGHVTFAVNRRNNKEARIAEILANHEPLKGPVDHSVPVLAVKRADGRWQAAVFGYACHTSSLGLMQWSGDYAGFAMLHVQQKYPQAQAMFFQACGADQGAMPRRKVELTEKYGRMLADGVGKVLDGSMRPLAGTLRTATVTIDLPYEKVMTREDLQQWAKRNALYARWAGRMLQQLDQGATFAKSWPYTIQAWRLGDQLWITLAGEAVVDYSLKFKQKYGARTWTSGFAHELTAYIPSRRVWEEGGYEGGYLGEYGLPAMRWAGDLEDRITAGVERVVAAVSKP
jgi:neutral ceramidase